MRALRVIGIFLLATVGLVTLSIAGLFTYASIDRVDTFAVADESFAHRKLLYEVPTEPEWGAPNEKRRFMVHAHRITPGSGTIYAHRFYTNGDVLSIDDEGYKKITIWTATGLPVEKLKLTLGDDQDALVIYSAGGSAWPDIGCSGYVSSGTVVVEPSTFDYEIKLRGTLHAVPPSKHDPRCEGKVVDVAFRAKTIHHEELSTWLGAGGDHPYDETYR